MNEIDLSVLQNFVTITKKSNNGRGQYKVKHNIVIIALLGILANAKLGMKFIVLLYRMKNG